MIALASEVQGTVLARREAIAIPFARGAIIAAVCGAGFSPPLTNVALAVALIALLCAASVRERLRVVLRMPVARMALALFALVALGMLWSSAPWAERLQQLSNWRPLVLMLIALSVFSTAQSKSRLAAVFVAFVAAGALLSFASWAAQRPIILQRLPDAVFRNTATQSMVMVLGLTMAVVLAFWRGPGAVTASRTRWMFAAAAGLLAANLLIVTTGRSGQMALAIISATLVLSLVSGRVRWSLLIGLPVAMIAVIATSPVVQKRFAQGWQEMQSVESAPELTSMGVRVVIWRTSVELVRESPWVGYGTGGFPAAYASKAALMHQGWRAEPAMDTHNQYLFLWVQLGVAGVLALLGFIAVAARQAAPRPWKQVSLALLLAWSATSLFSSHFQAFNEGHLLLLLLGVFLAPERGYAPAIPTLKRRSASTRQRG